jgi:glutaredoxin-like protein
MPLLTDTDRELVAARLAPITRPITLLLFTQTFSAPESAYVAKQVLDEVASLHHLVSVEEANLILDKERAASYGIEQVPSVVLLVGGADARMRFVGAPSGYEFASLVEAIIIAGTGDSGLSPESKALVAERVNGPLDLKVFVTPTCPHCPRAVTLAHRLAAENANITATCVEATEFLELSRRYRVTGVPKTVANDNIELLGAMPEDQFVRAVLGLDEA